MGLGKICLVADGLAMVKLFREYEMLAVALLLHPRAGAAGHAIMLVAASLQLSSRRKARWY